MLLLPVVTTQVTWQYLFSRWLDWSGVSKTMSLTCLGREGQQTGGLGRPPLPLWHRVSGTLCGLSIRAVRLINSGSSGLHEAGEGVPVLLNVRPTGVLESPPYTVGQGNHQSAQMQGEGKYLTIRWKMCQDSGAIFNLLQVVFGFLFVLTSVFTHSSSWFVPQKPFIISAIEGARRRRPATDFISYQPPSFTYLSPKFPFLSLVPSCEHWPLSFCFSAKPQ